MKKLEKYIISAAAAGIITIGCHTVTYADVSDTGTAVEETVSGPEETLSADMTSDYANVNTDIPNDNAADMAVMTSPDSIMDASAVSTDSITVSGELTIDESTEDISGTNWSFDAENNGATETDNALIMVNAGIEKVSVETDLTIVSAGVNRIAELLLSGAADVKVAGSGLFMIDRLGCSEDFTGSFGLTEGGSAALFLKSGADEYTLMNPSSAPGILDEAYILSGYDFIIPKGSEMDLVVTDDESGKPVSVSSLTVDKNSTLKVEAGGALVIEDETKAGGPEAASKLNVEGTLVVESNANVVVSGELTICGCGELECNGVINGNGWFSKFIFESEKADTAINLKDIAAKISSDTGNISCSGDCDLIISDKSGTICSDGKTNVYITDYSSDKVGITGFQAKENGEINVYIRDDPSFGICKTVECTDISGGGSFNLYAGILKASGTIDVSKLLANGILVYSNPIDSGTECSTLSGNEIISSTVSAGSVNSAAVIGTVRYKDAQSDFEEYATSIIRRESAEPEIVYDKVFTGEKQTYSTILSALGLTKSAEEEAEDAHEGINTRIRVVVNNNSSINTVYLTKNSDRFVDTADIVNITVMYEECPEGVNPAGGTVSTNTSYTGSGILGGGGMINTDGSSILIVIQSSSDPEDPDTPVDPEDPDVPADITGTSLTATAPEASHGYYPVAATAASDGLVSVTLQSDFLESVLEQEYQGIIINTEIGNVRIEKQDLRKLVSQTKSKSFRLVISSREEETEAGTKTVYTVSLYSGNVLIGNIEGLYTISLPYELKQGENAKDLKVMGTYSDGRSEEINCTFDEATGMVIFRTNRLGDFTITFSEPSENI